MSNERFTQGEWVIGDENNNCCEVCVELISGEVISFDLSRYGRYADGQVISREEMNANAHLISAAPDMYRALRGLLEAHRHVYGLDGAWDSEVKAAEKALAKADGE